jgi:hypothetical protein
MRHRIVLPILFAALLARGVMAGEWPESGGGAAGPGGTLPAPTVDGALLGADLVGAEWDQVTAATIDRATGVLTLPSVIATAAPATSAAGSTAYGGTGWISEGATANDFEGTFTLPDWTVDRTLAWPDIGGTVALMGAANAGNFTALGGTLTLGDDDGGVFNAPGIKPGGTPSFTFSGDPTLTGGEDTYIHWNFSAASFDPGDSFLRITDDGIDIFRITATGGLGLSDKVTTPEIDINALVLTAATMTLASSGGARSGWSKVTFTNAMVVACGAVTSCDITVATMDAQNGIENAYLVIDTPETALTGLTGAIGRTGALFVDYIAASDLKAAANTIYGNTSGERGSNLTGFDLPSMTASTTLTMHFISAVENLNTATGLTGTIYLKTFQGP